MKVSADIGYLVRMLGAEWERDDLRGRMDPPSTIVIRAGFPTITRVISRCDRRLGNLLFSDRLRAPSLWGTDLPGRKSRNLRSGTRQRA